MRRFLISGLCAVLAVSGAATAQGISKRDMAEINAASISTKETAQACVNEASFLLGSDVDYVARTDGKITAVALSKQVSYWTPLVDEFPARDVSKEDAAKQKRVNDFMAKFAPKRPEVSEEEKAIRRAIAQVNGCSNAMRARIFLEEDEA